MQRMMEEKVYCAIEEVTPVANKVQRAQSIQGRMAMKKVKFPKGAPWVMNAFDELMKFPNARHDDFVDTLAWIGMGLARQSGPRLVEIVKTDRPKTGSLAWVKWDSKFRDKERRLLSASGGF